MLINFLRLGNSVSNALKCTFGYSFGQQVVKVSRHLSAEQPDMVFRGVTLTVEMEKTNSKQLSQASSKDTLDEVPGEAVLKCVEV